MSNVRLASGESIIDRMRRATAEWDINARAQTDVARIGSSASRARDASQRAMFNTKMDAWNRMFQSQQEQRGGFADLMNSYNTAFAQAKAQNEQKYQQQLGLVDQTTGQQRDDVISQYQKQSANTMQRLARTGLGNTTVGDTLQQGNVRERTSALNRLSDQMTQQKLGVMQGFNYQAPDPGVVSTGIKALAPQFNYPTF